MGRRLLHRVPPFASAAGPTRAFDATRRPATGALGIYCAKKAPEHLAGGHFCALDGPQPASVRLRPASTVIPELARMRLAVDDSADIHP